MLPAAAASSSVLGANTPKTREGKNRNTPANITISLLLLDSNVIASDQARPISNFIANSPARLDRLFS